MCVQPVRQSSNTKKHFQRERELAGHFFLGFCRQGVCSSQQFVLDVRAQWQWFIVPAKLARTV